MGDALHMRKCVEHEACGEGKNNTHNTQYYFVNEPVRRTHRGSQQL